MTGTPFGRACTDLKPEIPRSCRFRNVSAATRRTARTRPDRATGVRAIDAEPELLSGRERAAFARELGATFAMR
jgi:hypothetical protein